VGGRLTRADLNMMTSSSRIICRSSLVISATRDCNGDLCAGDGLIGAAADAGDCSSCGLARAAATDARRLSSTGSARAPPFAAGEAVGGCRTARTCTGAASVECERLWLRSVLRSSSLITPSISHAFRSDCAWIRAAVPRCRLLVRKGMSRACMWCAWHGWVLTVRECGMRSCARA
jgi:hypothetical protein